MLEFSSFNILNNLNVSYSDTSAIRIRNNSTDNIVQYSQVSFTGRKEQHNGEAIYIGAALGHWINNLTGPDRSSRNRVFSNYIGPNVTAESVDIKEGVDNVIVENNTINGFGMEAENKALTWISVKGFNCTIRNNNGNSSVQDGFSVILIFLKIIFMNFLNLNYKGKNC